MEITATAAAVAPGGRCPSADHEHLAFEQVFRDRRRQTAPHAQEQDKRRQPVRAHDGLRTAVAMDHSLLAEAAALVSERYHWRGYETPGDGSDQRPSDTLVALQGGRVHGTLTLGFDGPGGLRADHTFGAQLMVAREQGRTLVELTRLAVAAQSNGLRILSALFALAYQRGRIAHGATDLVVEVNPRHVAAYRRLFGFTVASDERECGRVGAPAVLLWLDLHTLDRRLARHPETREASMAESGMPARAGRAAPPGWHIAMPA